MTLGLILAGIGALALLSIALMLGKLVLICPPNEVLVFSGTRRTVGNRSVGYRLVQGGLGVRRPVIEKVDRLDLTNMIIDIRVSGAYCKGGIPLNVEGVANVKIASSEPSIGNAIERFSGKSRADIMKVARETLEGNLRGVLATLTPEEVNHDRLKFAESLLAEADHDLTRLGLELDTLKIQNVSDDRGYLDSLGRKQSAALIMRSRIAEADNRALSAERDASNLENKEIARVEAEISKSRADAERRIIEAQTRKDALVAEERSKVASAVAKAQAEVLVQNARIEQVQRQLEADRIKPAEAARMQMIEAARGRAARVIEDGKANAESIRRISHTWAQSGDDARQILVAQKLSGLVGHLMQTLGHMNIHKMTIIDKNLAKSGSNLAVNAVLASEQLKHALGIDVPAILGRLGGHQDHGKPGTSVHGEQVDEVTPDQIIYR